MVVGVLEKFLGWNSGVVFDKCDHDTTSGFNIQRQRCDSERRSCAFFGSVAREDGGLDGIIRLLGSLPLNTNLTIREIQVKPPTRARFIDIRILEDPFDAIGGAAERSCQSSLKWA